MKRPGFTLLELMIVLALLLALAAIAVPVFTGALAGRQLSESAEQFRSLMFLTAAESRQTGRRMQVAFPAPLATANYLADHAGDVPVGKAYGEARVLIERDPLDAPGTFDEVKADYARWSTGSDKTQIARVEIAEPIWLGGESGGAATEAERRSEPPMIVFGPDGRSLVGDVTVTIVNDRLKGYVVKLRGATGLATIEPMAEIAGTE